MIFSFKLSLQILLLRMPHVITALFQDLLEQTRQILLQNRPALELPEEVYYRIINRIITLFDDI